MAKLPIDETTLKKFIDEILPQKFGVSTSNIMVMVGKDLLYERDEEMSDEEIF